LRGSSVILATLLLIVVALHYHRHRHRSTHSHHDHQTTRLRQSIPNRPLGLRLIPSLSLEPPLRVRPPLERVHDLFLITAGEGLVD
jgi:hypothetical protein